MIFECLFGGKKSKVPIYHVSVAVQGHIAFVDSQGPLPDSEQAVV